MMPRLRTTLPRRNGRAAISTQGRLTAVFHRNALINRLLSLVFLLAMASCGDLGSGCGCSMQPLPGGKLPADQTIEGGGQIRVTRAGFAKVSGFIGGVINDL